MSFTEANAVEQMVLDACQGLGWSEVNTSLAYNLGRG